MSVSEHDVAIFEEGFMLVAVNFEAVQALGEKTLWEAIQGHPWVVEQGIPLAVVYQMEDGAIRAFGDKDIIGGVSQMNFADITWGHTLTLEWAD